jgi:peptidoglycan/LPS O-acetylase OafA/YrhL
MQYTYRYFGIFRLVLAAMVMLQHFAANAAPMALTLAFRPYEPGSVAVLAFFCLSGFVIAEAADAVYRDKPRSFLINRVLRVLPHFAVAVALSFVLQGYFVATGTLHVQRFAPLPPVTVFAPQNFLLNLFNIVPYTNNLVTYRFVPIAWAVQVEMYLYLVIFACLLIGRTALSRRKDGFGAAAVGAAVLLLPCYVLAVLHKLPPTLGFLPYFSYGAGLYFSLKNCRLGLWIALASLPGMFWHFLSLPVRHAELGYERAVSGQLLLLALLVAAVTILAKARFGRFQKADSIIGGFTYPLYLYHYIVLIVVTSFFADLTYGTFAFGMLLSIAFSVAMARMLDPVIDRWRNRIRGGRLTAQATAA